jgi:hypothetical protein
MNTKHSYDTKSPTPARLLALVLLLGAYAASANENYHENALNADTRAKFVEVAANVRREMQAGGRYEYVKPDERKSVERKLAEMEFLFDQDDSVQSMKQDTKVKLFNAQEIVNSILTRRDRDRVICKNEPPLGSHIPVTSCHTYGQEEQARRETHNQLDEWKRLACKVAGCVGAPANRPASTGGDSR